MDYIALFKEKQIECDIEPYALNDIGTAQLFYDLHSESIRYVKEPRAWYVFDGRLWVKDEDGFYVMEMCKAFAQAYAHYAKQFEDDAEYRAYVKYAIGLTARKKREGILSDARSIRPI